MKKTIFMAMLVCAFSVAAFAQAKTADYSGTWTLDAAQSKMGERSRVESMTLTVAQTAKDIKVETKTTRAARPEGDGGAGMGRRGGFGGRFGGDTTMSYSLDGKETVIQQESPMGSIPVKLTAKLDGSALNLASSRTFTGPNGEITAVTKETWTLSADGKTLTVVRENQNPRGNNSTTMVFVKN